MLTVTLRSDDASTAALTLDDDADLDETYATVARFALGELTDGPLGVALTEMLDQPGTFDRLTVWDDDVAADFHLGEPEELPPPRFEPIEGLVAYAPDQARDWHGRWTTDGGAVLGTDARDAHSRADIVVDGGEVSVDRTELLPVLHDLGQRPETSDLTKVTIAGSELFSSVAHAKLRRIDMPQIPSDHVDEFEQYLNERGITTKRRSADPLTLRATQNELDGRKVGQMITKMQQGMLLSDDHPLWASSDGYILDGHHRWAAEAAMAIAGQGRRMAIVRVGLPMTTLLAKAREFNDKLHIKAKSIDAPNSTGGGFWQSSGMSLIAAGPVDEARDDHGRWTTGGADHQRDPDAMTEAERLANQAKSRSGASARSALSTSRKA